jgi:hypothetical protein
MKSDSFENHDPPRWQMTPDGPAHAGHDVRKEPTLSVSYVSYVVSGFSRTSVRSVQLQPDLGT